MEATWMAMSKKVFIHYDMKTKKQKKTQKQKTAG